ncbi:jg11719 [Pararge aegeria aegeria]|uniref:Jg11719 protein n=1 Tax=Pararge aegeria aegeria TaxID=348720 RepID=A0A8S4S3W1_9NEOP|nr:jg11719 [Pararge aegeria aegeria]
MWPKDITQYKYIKILLYQSKEKLQACQPAFLFSIQSTLANRILSYFGHITRRGNESIEKLIVVGNVEGKRPRGRSPTRWSDQLRETGARTFYNAIQMAKDRTRWREILYDKITRHTSDHDPQS